MFLNERAQQLIKELRDIVFLEELAHLGVGGVNTYKASICDAMSIIMFMYQMHASDAEKEC